MPTNTPDNHDASKSDDAVEPATPTFTGKRLWALRLVTLLISLVIAWVAAEVFLALFPPFELRVRGNQIVLPRNDRVSYNNPYPGRLEKTITITRNSIGFRGPEPPENFDKHLTVITVGGSTTECNVLSDGKTWPAHLGTRLQADFSPVWLNNAGLNGHSTFGHLILMRQFIADLKPDVVLFLVGINDVATSQIRSSDVMLIPQDHELPLFISANRSIARYSRLCALIDAWYRHGQARKKGLITGDVTHRDWNESANNPVFNQTTIEVSEEIKQGLLAEHKKLMLPAYEERLHSLITICREAGITPVLITQPALYGGDIDDRTGVDLSKMKIHDWKLDGATKWAELELYNGVTREVARQEGIYLIDLANTLPKSTAWYYDYVHYTLDGAVKVSDLIYQDLKPYLAREFPGYYRPPHSTP